MNVAKILEQRRVQWFELEQLCSLLEVRGRIRRGSADQISRFAALYRSACADLALATAYQLPPATVTYLHQLVARAHNQLYRSRQSSLARWGEILFYDAPQAIFADPCVRVATLCFFGIFSLAMFAGYQEFAFPGFAEKMLGAAQIEQMEASFEQPIQGSMSHYISMSAFYIQHNTGIGLRCFAFGILLVPCLLTLCFNAAILGASFGYMARPESVGGENFLEFVTAHGPFELTAIALSAGAGLSLGMGWFRTAGLSRLDSLRTSARRSIPIISAAAVLFVLAAFTEGFLSPSPLPYVVKAGWGIFSSGLLMFYFVVLGFPRGGPRGT